MMQRGQHLGVAAVGRPDLGFDDDLGVGVDGDMALVAVESTGGGFVAVARLGIHRRDHPVDCGAPSAAKRAVVGLLNVLADDRGQQGGGRVDLIGQGCVPPALSAPPSRLAPGHQ